MSRFPGLRACRRKISSSLVHDGLNAIVAEPLLGGKVAITKTTNNADPSTWDPQLDAVIAAPKHHKVIFENERLRVLDVTLEPDDEEPIHHHRWPSVFVFDQVQGPVHDYAPDGTQLPSHRDLMKALQAWDGQGCLVVNMAPQPLGRVLNASGKTIHGIRIEMKA
jgi:hypothetical protein